MTRPSQLAAPPSQLKRARLSAVGSPSGGWRLPDDESTRSLVSRWLKIGRPSRRLLPRSLSRARERGRHGSAKSGPRSALSHRRPRQRVGALNAQRASSPAGLRLTCSRRSARSRRARASEAPLAPPRLFKHPALPPWVPLHTLKLPLTSPELEQAPSTPAPASAIAARGAPR